MSDSGASIVNAIVAMLRERGALLPAAEIIERMGLAARAIARRRVEGALIEGLPPEKLQALDKVTTRTREVVVAVGDTVRFGTLRIDAAECLVNTPEATPDSVAFLTITDNKPAQATEKLFSGWMFASSPALSALDSSVYDVWVLACVTIPQASAPPSSK